MDTHQGPMTEASHNGWSEQENALLDARDVPRNRAARMMLYEAAQRTGLNPFSGQLYVALRNGQWRVEISLLGMRSVAADQEGYDGQDGPYWCGKDGEWRDAWVSDAPPVAARVGVRRTGSEHVTWGVAHYDEFVVLREDGTPDGWWMRMPRNQLAVAAERQALRKEFSKQLGGIYTADEVNAAELGGTVEAGAGVWEEREEAAMRSSAALVEAAALDADLTDRQKEVAAVLGKLRDAQALPDAQERYEKLRALWMKTGAELRAAETPEGVQVQVVLREALRRASGEAGRAAPAPGASQEPPGTGSGTGGEAAPQDPAPPQEAASEEADSGGDVSGGGEDEKPLTLKCGCVRARVLESGEHQPGCTKRRRKAS